MQKTKYIHVIRVFTLLLMPIYPHGVKHKKIEVISLDNDILVVNI